MLIPVSTVFNNHFSKQVETVLLIADQEDNDEIAYNFKDSISKTRKETDKIFIRQFKFVPAATRILLLYKQQGLFIQVHFPQIFTPPPNLA